MKMVLAIFATIALSAMTVAQSGTLRVSVREAETEVLIPGAQVVVMIDCGGGDCLLDLPDNETDLLAYLQVVAALRGIVDGSLQVRNPAGGRASATIPTQPNPALLASKGFVTAVTDAEGNAVFQGLAQGTYEVVAQRDGYGGPSARKRRIRIEGELPVPPVLLSLVPR